MLSLKDLVSENISRKYSKLSSEYITSINSFQTLLKSPSPVYFFLDVPPPPIIELNPFGSSSLQTLGFSFHVHILLSSVFQ